MVVFTGAFCETLITSSVLICQNGGSCRMDSNNYASCVFSPDFNDVTCDIGDSINNAINIKNTLFYKIFKLFIFFSIAFAKVL